MCQLHLFKQSMPQGRIPLIQHRDLLTKQQATTSSSSWMLIPDIIRFSWHQLTWLKLLS